MIFGRNCQEAPIEARSEPRKRRCWRQIAALLIAALASACDDTELSLPEVDASPYPDFKQYIDAPAAVVREAFGEPDNVAILDADSEEWAYAIRCCNPDLRKRRYVPAIHLRLFFDADGVFRDWGFFHPRTGERMEVKETLAQAKRQLPACGEFRLIADIFKVGETEQFEAHLRLTQHQTIAVKRYIRKVPWVEKHGDGGMLTFFVDRPGPFYWPPAFIILTIRNGHVSMAYLQGYTGRNFCGPGK